MTGPDLLGERSYIRTQYARDARSRGSRASFVFGRSLATARRRGPQSEVFALLALARKLAGAADGFRLLAGALFRRLLVGTPELHFAKDTLALHLLLQRSQGLIDIVVADDDLDDGAHLLSRVLNGKAPAVRDFAG